MLDQYCRYGTIQRLCIMTSETRSHRIRRLIYRSTYTGMRETDQLLGPFARECLGNMNDAELSAYEHLLECGDPLIWAWLSGNTPMPDNFDNPAFEMLRAWCEKRKS
jgi:succinate dehydrogenase flavin-adding protein (antitoxin of CptAB toxin-antitoxin module)